MEYMKLTYVLLQLNEELPEIVDGATTGKTVMKASNLTGYVDIVQARDFDEVFVYTKEGEFFAGKPWKHILNLQMLPEPKAAEEAEEVEVLPAEKTPSRKTRRAPAAKSRKDLN